MVHKKRKYQRVVTAERQAVKELEQPKNDGHWLGTSGVCHEHFHKQIRILTLQN